jgi:hypothetical protein
VQRALTRLEAEPSIKSCVRHLWLEAAPISYSAGLQEGEEDLEHEEYNVVTRQVDDHLARLLQLLSGSLVELTLHGDFSRYEFHKSIAKSIYHAKLIHLFRITMDNLGTIPLSIVEHLPPSLKELNVVGMVHFQLFEFNFQGMGQRAQAEPMEKTSLDLRSLTVTPGFPGNMAGIFHKKGLVNNLVELKLQIFANEVSTYLQVLKTCQATLQKLHIQFGAGFLDRMWPPFIFPDQSY